MNKKILFATSRLVDYAGSEVVVIELMQEFKSLGYEIDVAAFEASDFYKNDIDKLGAEYINLTADDCGVGLQKKYDIAWIQHNVVAYRVLLHPQFFAKKIIYSSLSPFEPIESPPISLIYVSKYLVNSEENLEYFRAKYPEYAEKVSVFPNSASENFWKIGACRKSNDSLKSLAIVSNHVPPELNDAIRLIKLLGVNVDVYGLSGKQVRVTEDVLERYDAVVTIGKTVQYCLALKLPVYCYDHFGGDGWLTNQLFDKSRYYNFSGRGGRGKVTAEKICDEIIDGYKAALLDVPFLYSKSLSHFSLRNNIDALRVNDDWGTSVCQISVSDKNILRRQSDLFVKQRNIIDNEVVARRTVELRCIELERNCLELERNVNEIGLAYDEMTAIFDQLKNKRLYKFMKNIDNMILRVKKIYEKLVVYAAWFKFLIERSVSVIKYQGFRGFIKKAYKYLVAARRRFLAKYTSKSSIFYKAGTAEKIGDVLVSFVIPVYDRTDVLREAIKSALAQTVKSIEVIIVTDGSPKETLEVVDEFSHDSRVKIFKFPVGSGNAVRGRNKGILEARGKYISFLDSDDISLPDRLERSLPLLESGQADVVYGAWEAMVDGTRTNLGINDGQVIYSPNADLQMLIESSVLCQSTATVRKSLLIESGFLKPSMKYREDHELWARLAFNGGVFKSVANVLTKLRLHDGNNELNFIDNDDYWFARVGSEYRNKGPIPKKIAFILPGVGISGGIAVVLRHAQMLMEAGHDAFVINVGEDGDASWFTDNVVPIVHISDSRNYVLNNIDLLFATGWATVEWLAQIESARKLYFVQSDERRFFDDLAMKKKIHNTYLTDCEYLTEAYWIKDLLFNEFGHQAAYVPNGIDLKKFNSETVLEPKTSKVRVLLEGPIIVPFKGLADSYDAVKDLDCEIWIVSSAGRPPSDWRCDRFFESVSFGDMAKIYASCDIFLKMSRIEGFFGPPMEAMACGCAVVVSKVTGYDEYIVNEKNALVVEMGDIVGAGVAVERLINDIKLRSSLIEGGLETVKSWDWGRSAKAMLSLVNSR